eukprot:746240-Hanusia_phi.AAC.2
MTIIQGRYGPLTFIEDVRAHILGAQWGDVVTVEDAAGGTGPGPGARRGAGPVVLLALTSVAYLKVYYQIRSTGIFRRQ